MLDCGIHGMNVMYTSQVFEVEPTVPVHQKNCSFAFDLYLDHLDILR